MEHAEHLALHTCILCRARERLELFTGLLAQIKPLHVGGSLVAKFLPPGLDCEVFLGMGNFRFARVAVLGDEVAGEAGKVVIINHLNRTFTAGDRFAGAGKVMLRAIARGFARSHGAFDRVFKAAPLAVAQQRLQVAGAPVFGTMLVGSSQFLEGFAAECGK